MTALAGQSWHENFWHLTNAGVGRSWVLEAAEASTAAIALSQWVRLYLQLSIMFANLSSGHYCMTAALLHGAGSQQHASQSRCSGRTTLPISTLARGSHSFHSTLHTPGRPSQTLWLRWW